jgi:hypothetical protein
MALPTIAINSGTGSDTAASGAGPGTALAGTLAATNATTTVNITDAVALGGVLLDGSAALWVASTSGRRWAKITNITGSSGAWVVTVADAYTLTEGGKSWAIGGKRATLSGSLQLGADCRGGWTIDLQTDDTLTANFNLKPNAVAGVWTMFTSTSGTRPTVTTSTNAIQGIDLQGANNLVISHIRFRSTAGTPGDGIALAGFSAGASYVIVSDCVVEGFRNGIMDHDVGGNADIFAMQIEGCEVKGCVTGIQLWAGAEVDSCYVHNNTAKGLQVANTRQRPINLVGSIFDSNGTGGAAANYGALIQNASQTGTLIDHCVFSNSLSAVSLSTGLDLSLGTATDLVIKNSIFYGNGKYGISASDVSNLDGLLMRNNAFGGNGTAATQTITTGSNPITLTANPFVSSTDFALNSTAGGGAACKGVATAIPNASATATAPDVGAVQSGGGGAAGGASGPVIGCGFIKGLGAVAA